MKNMVWNHLVYHWISTSSRSMTWENPSESVRFSLQVPHPRNGYLTLAPKTASKSGTWHIMVVSQRNQQIMRFKRGISNFFANTPLTKTTFPRVLILGGWFNGGLRIGRNYYQFASACWYTNILPFQISDQSRIAVGKLMSLLFQWWWIITCIVFNLFLSQNGFYPRYVATPWYLKNHY